MESIESIETRYTDIIRRGIKRELPCKLTDEEELRIARQMVGLKAELAEREAEWDIRHKKHKQEVAETERAIAKMERELHTGQQDRIVICNEVFERGHDGGGWAVILRLDPAHQLPGETREVQRIPASASDMQRFLPTLEPHTNGKSSVLDDARAQQQAVEQRSAAPVADDVPSDDVPSDEEWDASEAGDDAPEAGDDDPLGIEEVLEPPTDEPLTKLAKFDADAVANGWCGLRSESGSPCVLKANHKGLHKTEEGWGWRARRPKVEHDQVEARE